jgi:hypothetical protein
VAKPDFANCPLRQSSQYEQFQICSFSFNLIFLNVSKFLPIEIISSDDSRPSSRNGFQKISAVDPRAHEITPSRLTAKRHCPTIQEQTNQNFPSEEYSSFPQSNSGNYIHVNPQGPAVINHGFVQNQNVNPMDIADKKLFATNRVINQHSIGRTVTINRKADNFSLTYQFFRGLFRTVQFHFV